MANAIKEKNGLAITQAIRDTFSSFSVVFKALSSNEENENEEILNEEVLEIKKQESKNKISSLEEMLENNNGTKAKKTGLKNRVKTNTGTTRRQKLEKINEKDIEKEIGD